MKKIFPRTTLTTSAVTHVAAAAAVVARAAVAARTPAVVQKTARRGRPCKAKPYEIDGRSGWWANPTLPDGTRPLKSFESEEAAASWIKELYEAAAKDEMPALGGPDQATLAQALYKYALLFTVVKGGAEAEQTRINNYLKGGGLLGATLSTDSKAWLERELAKPFAGKTVVVTHQTLYPTAQQADLWLDLSTKLGSHRVLLTW